MPCYTETISDCINVVCGADNPCPNCTDKPNLAALFAPNRKAESFASKPEKLEIAEVRKSPSKIIALDFDGTCVTHEYPDIGKDAPYCVEVLKRLDANGVKFILWTMRSGGYLQDAVDWFESKGIELWGINENPEQCSWTSSPKCYAPVYIDDAAIGCPLRESYKGGRPVVDWQAVEKLLQQKNYL